MLHWNIALWLDIESHLTSFNQSESFISVQRCHFTLKSVYDIVSMSPTFSLIRLFRSFWAKYKLFSNTGHWTRGNSNEKSQEAWNATYLFRFWECLFIYYSNKTKIFSHVTARHRRWRISKINSKKFGEDHQPKACQRREDLPCVLSLAKMVDILD